jgi:hypothetical protein
MLRQTASDPVREFLTRTLTAAGGLVEPAPDGLDALLPIDAARRLGIAEELSIHLAPSDVPAGNDAVDGRIGSPFLEQLVAARLERAPIAAVVLPAGLPVPLPENLPVLLNAVRLGNAERVRGYGRFLAAELRVTLHGEELRSVLASLTIRIRDGARTEPFRAGGARPVRTAPLAEHERASIAAALRGWLRREGPVLHASGLEALRRRARRDLERMAEYYASLDAEMAKATGRARSADERARRLVKRAALPADLDARREQLRARIRPRLAARLVAATLVESDVEHFEFPVRRRNRRGRVTLASRMADGVLEGPACAGCGVATLRFYLCDDQLHVLCDACGRPGRLDAARCPACHGLLPQPPVVRIDDPTAHLPLGADVPAAPR